MPLFDVEQPRTEAFLPLLHAQKTLKLLLVDINLLTVVPIRLQQCCAALCQHSCKQYCSMTLVRTMLLKQYKSTGYIISFLFYNVNKSKHYRFKNLFGGFLPRRGATNLEHIFFPFVNYCEWRNYTLDMSIHTCTSIKIKVQRWDYNRLSYTRASSYRTVQVAMPRLFISRKSQQSLHAISFALTLSWISH